MSFCGCNSPCRCHIDDLSVSSGSFELRDTRASNFVACFDPHGRLLLAGDNTGRGAEILCHLILCKSLQARTRLYCD
jgi:hypothetical protein